MQYDLTSTDYDHTKICDTEYAYGEHAFVWARPIKHGWSHYEGGSYSGTHEYRPVRVHGHGPGMRVDIFGSAYSYPMTDFEFTYEVK